MQLNKNHLLSLIAFALVIGGLAYGLLRPYMHDDSANMIMAEEMLAGNGAYHYYDNKPPGLYATLALGIKLFGQPDVVGRVFAWLASVLISIFSALFICRESGRNHHLIVGIFIYFALFLAGSFLPLADVGMTLFLILGIWIICRGGSSSLRMFLGGVTFAIAVQFKQTALAMPLAIIVALSAQFIGKQLGIRDTAKLAISHIAGFLVALAGCWAIYAELGVADAIWQQCVLSMATEFESRHSVNYGMLLLIRSGWFIVPALFLILLRMHRLRILKDPLCVQLVVTAVMMLLFPLTRRFYSHYVMATIPMFVFIIHRSLAEQDIALRSLLTLKRVVSTAVCIAICASVLVFIKRESIEKTFVAPQQETAEWLARELSQWTTGSEQGALFLESGPNDMKPTAMYFYTGDRPPIRLLFFHNIPEMVRRDEIKKIPALIDNSTLRVVTFNPEHEFHPYYYPLSAEDRQHIHTQLKKHFTPRDDVFDHLWVRKNIEAVDPKIDKGPYAY